MSAGFLARVSKALASLAVLGLLVSAALVIFVMTSDAFDGVAFPVDFAAFWGAAELALDGRAAEAFDLPTITEVQSFPPSYEQRGFPWMYPPTWHLVVLPFGALPFWAAWWLFALLGLAAFLAALHRWSGRIPGGLNLILASPVAIIGTLNGNNGLLTAAVLVAALSALSTGRQARAGLLVAALAVKPTLGLLLPFALAAGGYWRAFLWAALGAVAFLLVATAAFGVGYWETFLAAVQEMPAKLANGGIPLEMMVTFYGFARAVGASHDVALWLQGGALLAAIAICLRAWSLRAPLALKGAVLLIAAPLAAPYAHYYEMSFTLAGAVLFIAARGGRRVLEQALIALVWALPAAVTVLRDPPLLSLTAAPVSTLLLVVVLTHLPRGRA